MLSTSFAILLAFFSVASGLNAALVGPNTPIDVPQLIVAASSGLLSLVILTLSTRS